MRSESDAPKQNPDNFVSGNNVSKNGYNEILKILLAQIQVIEAAVRAYQTQQTENKRRERKRFWLELLTLIAIVFYGGLAWLIWQEMISTGRQTDKLIKTATEQSESTEKLAGAAINLSKAAIDQVKELKASVKATQDTANATRSSAQTASESLTFSERSFRTSMRPYMHIKTVDIKDFIVGKAIAINVVIENSGKTPALDVTVLNDIQVEQKRPGFGFDKNYDREKSSQGTVGAGGTIRSTILGPQLSQETLDRLNRGQLRMIAHGVIRYRDIFMNEKSPPHETTFCMFYSDMTMAVCTIGNAMK